MSVRGFFNFQSEGLDEIVSDLMKLESGLTQILYDALDARFEVIEDQIRKNWLAKGHDHDGYISSSIYHSIHISDDGNDVYGNVGVFDLEPVRAKFGFDKAGREKERKRINEAIAKRISEGKTVKRKQAGNLYQLNAAQIAYWIENGTSRLAKGRKKKDVIYNAQDLIDRSPNPFVMPAFTMSLSEQERVFIHAIKMAYKKMVN